MAVNTFKQELPFGKYPQVSLSEARELARNVIDKVKIDKVDPILERKIAKQQRLKDSDNTFQVIAKEWLKVRQATLAPSTHLKIKQTFNANVYNLIGKLPIKAIGNRMVRNCLQIMEKRGATELMEKARGWIKQVFDFALSDNLISEATIRKAFRTLFEDYHIVPHSCRHFFSTQANENGLFRHDVIEAALSHGSNDAMRAIYNEATYDDERRKLAQWWSDELDLMRGGAKVISIGSTNSA